jgi:hypothetical protein
MRLERFCLAKTIPNSTILPVTDRTSGKFYNWLIKKAGMTVIIMPLKKLTLPQVG